MRNMIIGREGQVNRHKGKRIRMRLLIAILIPAWSTVSMAVASDPWFVEIPPVRSGLDFRFEGGSRGRFDLPEIMGGGFAVADFDADGLPDLFFCQGGPIDPATRPGGDASDSAGTKNAAPTDPPCIWYENPGSMRFRRIENAPAGPACAMGAWPADFDADGRTDLFVTGWKGWALYRNLGGWKFEDRTAELGRDVSSWSTAAVWRDFDRDGHLDLFVGGYVEFDPKQAPYCAAPDGKRDYCGPEDFPPVANRLFAGDGQGGFTDVSHRLGATRGTGRTLGALAYDFDTDGDDDLFVANDGTACELLVQGPGGSFRDEALKRGLAFDAAGNALAAMGVALIHSGRETNLFVTNFFGRGTVQFRGGSDAVFRDVSAMTGLRQATSKFNGFGIAVTDFDGDGIDEVVQANGHVLSRERLGTPFAMPPALLLRSPDTKFAAAGRAIFPVADRPMLGRGLVAADFDGDRKLDLMIARLDGPPVLLRNVTPGNVRTARNPKNSGAGGSYLSGIEPGGITGGSP